MFYKIIEENRISMIGKSSVISPTSIEITEEKYNQLMELIQTRPSDTLEIIYYLSAETETYVGRETTHDEKVEWYVSAVRSKQMNIDEVPEEYQKEVKAKLPTVEPTYTLDEASEIIAQGVSAQ